MIGTFMSASLDKKDRPKVGFGDPLVPYANYIDSMLILAEFEHSQVYDYLLRSDMDCFLTPGTDRNLRQTPRYPFEAFAIGPL